MSRGRHNAGTARLYAAASASPSARARRLLAPTPDPRGALGENCGTRRILGGLRIKGKFWDARILGGSRIKGRRSVFPTRPSVRPFLRPSISPAPSTRPSVHPSTATRLSSHPSVRPAVHKPDAAIHLSTTDLPVRRSVHPSSSVHLFGASVRPSEHSSIQRPPNLLSSVRPPEHSVCSSPARLSVHLSIHQFGHPSVSPSTPSVRPPTHVSIPPPIHLPVHAPTRRAHPLHPPTQEPSTTLHSGPALSNGVSVHPSIRPPKHSSSPSIRSSEHSSVRASVRQSIRVSIQKFIHPASSQPPVVHPSI